MCGCLLHAPYWGPGPQPKCVPGIQLEATFGFTGRCSVHCATAAGEFVCLFLSFNATIPLFSRSGKNPPPGCRLPRPLCPHTVKGR